MSQPHIPPPRIDLATLPPLIATSDKNSFAEFTLKVRDPEILQNMLGQAWFSPDLKRDLKRLQDELIEGTIRALREDAPDAKFWRAISKPYIGRTWLDVPWFWAETFFYRRILEILRYFQIDAWRERDPFAPLKNAELVPDAAPLRVQTLLQHLPDDRAERFEMFMHSALWGNRVDLSYNVEQKVGRAAHVRDERDNLLVDDSARVWAHFAETPPSHLVYICDNAGTELALDLAFVDFLLDKRLAQKITLHLKPQPFYVSDAMPQDVELTLQAFEKANEATQSVATRALAKRLRAQLAAKRLELRVHWFYPTPLHYFEMPDDLFALLRAADFVILKGDVNYRRLVGDAHWKPTIGFEYVTRYFPSPLVSLRTCKSDPIVGLTAEQVEALNHADPEWRVNGKRGVVQAHL